MNGLADAMQSDEEEGKEDNMDKEGETFFSFQLPATITHVFE